MRVRGALQVSTPTLLYCDFYGQADYIRYSFAYAGLPLREQKFTPEEWIAKFHDNSFGGLSPRLEVEGQLYSEYGAIVQYVASTTDLIPNKLDDRIRAMTISEMVDAMRFAMEYKIEMLVDKNDQARTDMQPREKALQKLLSDPEARDMMKPMEDLIENDKGCVTSDDMTYADIAVATFLHSLVELAGPQADIIEQRYPHMWQIMKNVYSNPRIHKHMERATFTPDLYCESNDFEAMVTRVALMVAEIKYNLRGEADFPTLKKDSVELAVGFQPCLLWINSRFRLIPEDSDVQLLAMWNIVDMIRSMMYTWGTATENERLRVAEVNRKILETQSREGFCVGHMLSMADIAAATFYEFYMDGHSVGVKPEDLTAFRNSHRLVFGIPNVTTAFVQYENPPTLYYFDFPGKGEAIRLLCHATGFNFNDVRIPMEAWIRGKYRSHSPTGKLPCMQFGDRLLVEQTAILAFIAAQNDMLPSTLSGQYLTRVVESAAQDIVPIINQALQVRTNEERAEILKPGIISFLTDLNHLVETYKTKNSMPQYLVEDRFTYGDFLIAGLMAGTPLDLGLDFTNWMSLKPVYDNVISLPPVMKHLRQRKNVTGLLSNWSPDDKVSKGGPNATSS